MVTSSPVLGASKGEGIAALFFLLIELVQGLRAGETWAWGTLAAIVGGVIFCLLVDHFVFRHWREADRREAAARRKAARQGAERSTAEEGSGSPLR